MCSSPDGFIKHILSYTQIIKIFLVLGVFNFVFHNLGFFFFFFNSLVSLGLSQAITALTISDWKQILIFSGRIGVFTVNAKNVQGHFDLP